LKHESREKRKTVDVIKQVKSNPSLGLLNNMKVKARVVALGDKYMENFTLKIIPSTKREEG
jgi:hypothetical protein